jgi:hypothetical protein
MSIAIAYLCFPFLPEFLDHPPLLDVSLTHRMSTALHVDVSTATTNADARVLTSSIQTRIRISSIIAIIRTIEPAAAL